MRSLLSSGTATKLLIALLVGLVAVPNGNLLWANLGGSHFALTTPLSVRAQQSNADLLAQYDLDGDGDLNCGEFESRAEAQAALEADPSDPFRLDQGGEQGVACEEFGYAGSGGSDVADPAGGVTAEEPLDLPLEPIPSDLPSDLPTAVEPAVPTTVEAPGDCDVEVRNGRAFVFTDCADGTVRAGFEPFEGFDEFAARAQNGFGAFDGSESAGTTAVEVQQAVPVRGSSSGTTSRDSASSETRLVEGKQRARGEKAKKAKKKKARMAKRKRAAERKAKRMRRMRSDIDD